MDLAGYQRARRWAIADIAEVARDAAHVVASAAAVKADTLPASAVADVAFHGAVLRRCHVRAEADRRQPERYRYEDEDREAWEHMDLPVSGRFGQ